MAIESLQALVTASENRDICDVIIESDCVDRGVTQAESLEKMRGLYAAIRRAQRGYDPKLRSASGMVGGDGEKMRAYVQRGKTICGDYIGGVIAQALEMGESNACMKCIVAAPTAGSCGVLPAVLLPYQQREGLSDEAMVRANAGKPSFMVADMRKDLGFAVQFVEPRAKNLHDAIIGAREKWDGSQETMFIPMGGR